MPLSSAIANDTRSHHTEFTQKIHHADDDDDARHQAAQHNHHRPIAGRAPRRPCSDRSGCCGRTASSTNADDDSICPARRQRQFFSGAVAIATMHLSTRNSSRGKRLLLAHPSIITASAIARPLSSYRQSSIIMSCSSSIIMSHIRRDRLMMLQRRNRIQPQRASASCSIV